MPCNNARDYPCGLEVRVRKNETFVLTHGDEITELAERVSDMERYQNNMGDFQDKLEKRVSELRTGWGNVDERVSQSENDIKLLEDRVSGLEKNQEEIKKAIIKHEHALRKLNGELYVDKIYTEAKADTRR